MLERMKKSRVGRWMLLTITEFLSVLNQVIPKNKNKILFYDSGRDFLDDNTEAIYSWLKNNGYEKKYRFIVCVPGEKVRAPFSAYDPVGPIRGITAYLTSKYVFFSFGDFRIRPSKHQIVVNQWHGTPIKKIGKLTQDLYYQREKLNHFTYLLSASETYIPVLSKAFGCFDEQVKVTGNARCDYLFSQKNSLEMVGIHKSLFKKCILWMPTFRMSKDGRFRDGNFKANETLLPILNTYDDLFHLNKLLEDLGILIVIKIHPMAVFKKNTYKNIMIMTNDDLIPRGVRLYEFVKEFDALITDYSSIYCDYLILDRPMGFTLDDFEEYEDSRGFVLDDFIDYMPGHHLYTVDDMMEFIKDMACDRDIYKTDRKKITPVFCKYVDGENCRRLAELVGLEK